VSSRGEYETEIPEKIFKFSKQPDQPEGVPSKPIEVLRDAAATDHYHAAANHFYFLPRLQTAG
jgi:hypothetical protein